jgi:hypothetical protein
VAFLPQRFSDRRSFERLRCGRVLDLRLYRASLLPLAVVALVAAFSLSALPGPLTSTLPPVAFNGARAYDTLEALVRSFPNRAPGSAGDDALAADIARRLAADGLEVHTITDSAETIRGRRRIETVIATRAGSGGAIVILAHRDAAHGASPAELSGTATLVELASDLSVLAAKRPLIFVSTSGGSGGDAGAALAAASLPRPIDAALVIGDVAGTQARRPYVVAWSGDGGAASLVLQQTVTHALSAELGQSPGGASILAQLARFALPLTVGEQAPLDDARLAAVLVQQSGELGPTADEPVSAARLATFGRGMLAAITALEAGPELTGATTRDLTVDRNELDGWVVRALVGLLILSSADCTLDVLARARRRRIPIGRWMLWVVGWAAPFLAAGLFAKFLAWSGVLSPTPPAPITSRQLPLGGSGEAALVSVLVVFALACIARTALSRGGGLDGSEATAGAPVALLTSACVLAAILWVVNPYTAALVALPLALWLIVMTRDRRHSVPAGALCLLCSLAPLGVLLGIEAHALSLGPLGFAWTWLLVFAGGEVGLGALLTCALAGGVTFAAALILLHPMARGEEGEPAITVRGPASYAGPGSLGGTDSALRR